MTASSDIKTCMSTEADIQDLAALAAGDIQALILRRFASPEICTAAAAALDLAMMGGYDPARYVVPAQRFGPTLNEYRAAGTISADYWQHAHCARTTCRRTTELQRLRETCRRQLSIACRARCVPAASGGRSLYWGILREINHGTLVHWDDVLQEYPSELLTTRITGQIAFNLFLTAPASGGETSVWRKQPSVADERYRLKFGYHPEVVDGIAATRIKPEQGTAVLFNSRNYHQVHPCTQNETRLAFSFFVGLTGEHDTLLLWS